MRTRKPKRVCAQCGELFQPPPELTAYPQRFCSIQCAQRYRSDRAKESYPPREDIERMWCELGLTDAEIGARFGRSYNWSLTVRKHYVITGAMKPPKAPKVRVVHHGYVMIGKQYQHRLVMEEKLKRKLLPGEVVHHIDGDRSNNAPENLSLFKSNGEHTSHEATMRGKKGKRDWRAAREKVWQEAACRVCGRTDVRLEAAHIIARAWTKAGADEGEHPENIVPLCAERCHPAYDQSRTLDLLPYLTLPEQARAVLLHPGGLVGAYRRVTNSRELTA